MNTLSGKRMKNVQMQSTMTACDGQFILFQGPCASQSWSSLSEIHRTGPPTNICRIPVKN